MRKLIFIILAVLVISCSPKEQLSEREDALSEACITALEFYNQIDNAQYIDCTIREDGDETEVFFKLKEGFPFSERDMLNRGYIKRINNSTGETDVEKECEEAMKIYNQTLENVNCTIRKYRGEPWVYIEFLPEHEDYEYYLRVKEEVRQKTKALTINKVTGTITDTNGKTHKKTEPGFEEII